MLDCISRRAAPRRVPGRHPDGHELHVRPDPRPHPREVRRGPRPDHQGLDRREEPFAWNGEYTQLRYVNLWPKPIQKPHPPIYIPGGGSIETWDFCLDHDYNYSYLSFTGHMAGKKLHGRLLGAGGRARQGRVAVPGGVRPDHLRGRHRRRGRAALRRAHALLLQPLPPRLSRLLRSARLPDGRTPSRRACSNQLRRENQEKFQTRSRGRTSSRSGFVIAGSPETVREQMRGDDPHPARRHGVLPAAHGRHAGLEDPLLEPAVRRQGHAPPPRRVGRTPSGPTTTAGGATRSTDRVDVTDVSRPGGARPGPASTRNGSDLAPSVRTFGDGTAPPLVFLHGAGGLFPVRAHARGARRRRHRVFAPVWPGYGEESPDEVSG